MLISYFSIKINHWEYGAPTYEIQTGAGEVYRNQDKLK